MGNYPLALSYFEKALEIQQKSLPSDHPNLALNYNNIAVIHQSMGNDTMSLSCFEKALEIQQNCLPSNHPHLVTTQNNVAILRQLAGIY